MSDGVLFRTEYFDIVQDINAALLMSQIHYWYMPDKNGKSKLRVYKNGEWWIAKSYAEWWKEVRLSRGQVERALKCLERHNLIRVKVFQFNGHPTRHIICDVLSKIPLDKRESIDILRTFYSTPACNLLHESVQCITETTTESTTQTTYATVPVALSKRERVQGKEKIEVEEVQEKKKRKKNEKNEKKEEKKEEKSKKGKIINFPCLQEKEVLQEQEKKKAKEMKAEEVLKKFEEKKAEGVKGSGVNAMALLWKKRVSLHQEWVKNLSPKEVGQLKHVHKALGPEAIGVLDWALQNWQVFAHEVQVQKGVMPAMAPHVGFFCKHWEVAYRLSKKPAAPLQSAPLQSIAVVHTPTVHTPTVHTPTVHTPTPINIKPGYPDDDEPRATLEDVLATLELLAAITSGKKSVG